MAAEKCPSSNLYILNCPLTARASSWSSFRSNRCHRPTRHVVPGEVFVRLQHLWSHERACSVGLPGFTGCPTYEVSGQSELATDIQLEFDEIVGNVSAVQFLRITVKLPFLELTFTVYFPRKGNIFVLIFRKCTY